MKKIKVGILISYDWTFVFTALKCVYEKADEIVLAIDRDRLTWIGNKFELPDDFVSRIEIIDSKKKIRIYEDKFYRPGYSAMENDTNERMMLAKELGSDCWHIQVDSDEYFVDFGSFIDCLRNLEMKYGNRPIQVFADWIFLLKSIDNGFIYIDGFSEPFPVATNAPNYQQARHSSSKEFLNVVVHSRVYHQSWARTEAEIYQKLKNWSHTNDFDVESYYRFWQTISKDNYLYLKDFHPFEPAMWPRMDIIEGKLEEIVFKPYSKENPSIELQDFWHRLLRKIKRKLKIRV